MTEEEAVKIVSNGYSADALVTFQAGGFVKCLADLGVLKLTEAPKSPAVKLHDALSHTKLIDDYGHIMDYIDTAGLKLVDK